MSETGDPVKTRLVIRPIELRDANDFIEALHRHHKRVVGHRFSIALWNGSVLVGVACVGRPVARMTDQRSVLEVTRLCTDGTKNACSMLYSAASRVGKELGYEKIQTFILESEPGTSLVASGWKNCGVSGGGTWSRVSRGRVDKAPLEKKVRYEKNTEHEEPMTYRTADPEADAENYYWRMEHTCACGKLTTTKTRCSDCDSRVCSECEDAYRVAHPDAMKHEMICADHRTTDEESDGDP